LRLHPRPVPGPALAGGRLLASVLAVATLLAATARPGRGAAPAPAASRSPAPAAAALPARPAAPRCLIKPQPPLDVKLEAFDPLRPGEVARFRLTAIPRVAAEEIRVEAQPAAEVAWVAGRRSDRRAARRDEPTAFEFSVRVPARGRHALHVTVEMTAADGTVWRRGAGLGLGPDPRAERARVVADGRGGRAIEYEAAPAAAGAGR
jgi:hypothetical protein